MMKITAVIPARKENGELGNRNLLPLGDKNLLTNKIEILKKVKGLDEIIISSDDDEILTIARKEGASVQKRPENLRQEDIKFSEIVTHICSEVQTELTMFTFLTTPFIKTETYEKAIQLYKQKSQEGYDSLITVCAFRGFLLDENGALNFRTGKYHKQTSMLPELYMFSNGLTIAPTKKMLEWQYYWGHLPYRMLIDKWESMMIKDAKDYKLAEIMMRYYRETGEL